MSLPTPLVEMDTVPLLGGGFTLDDPVLSLLDMGIPLDFSNPTFTEDITSYVRGFTTDRGASNEIEHVENGTATLRLDNRDGAFTPFQPGPYFPYITPMRRIRIRAEWPGGAEAGIYDSDEAYDFPGVYGGAGILYPIYMGYVEEWPYTFPGEMDTEVTVRLVDGFDLLGSEGAHVSGNFPQQQSGERVAAILSAASWPPSMTSVDTGVAVVPAVTLTDVSALAHIQEIEFAEQGRFFIDRAGNAVFRERGTSASVSAIWADDGSGLPYRSSLQPRYGRTNIRNDIRLTRPGGVQQVVEDAESIKDFGRRSFVREVQLTLDADVLSLADYILTRDANPQLRIESIDDLAMRHEDWATVLGLELNDTGEVIESRLELDQVSLIQRIHHEYDGESWNVSFQVSPTVVETYARLDDAAFRLDDNFVLGR